MKFILSICFLILTSVIIGQEVFTLEKAQTFALQNNKDIVNAKLDQKIIMEISNLLGFLVLDDGNQPSIYHDNKLLFESKILQEDYIFQLIWKIKKIHMIIL
jgi:hypothetical protein